MLTLNSKPYPNPDVVGHVVDDQAVVVVPEHGNVKVFNEVGTHIWKLIDGNRPVGEIADLVCQAFDVDGATAEQDTIEFITVMLQHDIIYLAPE